MGRYGKNILTAVICFLAVVVLNFMLPRLLPGNPIAYLTGFAEEDMTPTQYETYQSALHLNESTGMQFLYYLRSLVDGTLGYSFKKDAVVSKLILERLGYTLQITLPAAVLSTWIGLIWGLRCGYKSGGAVDTVSTSALIVLNAVPTFLIGLLLIICFCFQHRWFPYTGLSSGDGAAGAGWLVDRLRHLFLPVLTLTLATLPSRFLLMRNTAKKISEEKYVLYAKQRGLSDRVVRSRYLLKNIAPQFVTMTGMSVSSCVGGTLVVENIFSVKGMGKLLTEAVNTLDYPLMQGILFVTALMMAISIIVTDIICILIDPKVRWGEYVEK